MFARNIRITRTAIAFALATGIAMGSSIPAFAAGGDTTATVTGGALTLTGALPGPFAGRSITGVAQTTTAALAAFSASDLRGSGAGWHVTAQATTFAGVSKTLAAGSLTLSAPTVAPATGTTSQAPTVAAGPYTIDNGAAVQIASAALNTGMGTYDFSATTLTLALPGNVFADTYASTITISEVTAP